MPLFTSSIKPGIHSQCLSPDRLHLSDHNHKELSLALPLLYLPGFIHSHPSAFSFTLLGCPAIRIQWTAPMSGDRYNLCQMRII